MLHKILPVGIFSTLIFFACVSSPGIPERSFWDTSPVSNELFFLGAADIFSNREESIHLALEDAARKAVIFNLVEGQFASKTNIGAGFLDYSSETRASIKYNENYKDLVDALIFDPKTDVRLSNNTVFVHTRYIAPYPVQTGYFASSQGKSMPGWIASPPDIAGYIVGVGYAGRRASHKDTVNISYENAIYSILKIVSSTIKGYTENSQGSGTFDNSSATNNVITASGVLKGFYVLDFWVDPATQAVWTLAIADIL
jgi:hypothetical protein